MQCHLIFCSIKMKFLLILFFSIASSQYLPHLKFKFSEKLKGIPENLSVDSSNALFLSPLLEDPNRDVEVIQDKAQITHPKFANTPSYSGYFTVNKAFNSNMFFVYTEAEDDAPDTPVVLWLNGGPGLSSLHGFFLENGPFKIVDNQLVKNEFSWHRKAHMLYIDNPIGSGFSFTENPKGYSTDQASISANLYSALVQFFTLFPTLKSRKFYLSGQSYAAKYIPPLGILIHQKNRKFPQQQINFKGVMLGNGFWDPYSQIVFSEFYYQLGLVDNIVKKKLESVELMTRLNILAKNFSMALGVFTVGFFLTKILT